MRQKPTKYQAAQKIVTNAIAKDKGLYEAFQANIAMAFVDECLRFRRTKSEKKQKKMRGSQYYLSQSDLHTIANKSADYFLTLWLGRTATAIADRTPPKKARRSRA